MDIRHLLAHLEQNPGDWDTRKLAAKICFEERKYEEAARLIADSPEIPFQEEAILFAATILGRIDPGSAHALLDEFLASAPSAEAWELKARLHETAGDDSAAAACRERAGSGREPDVVARVAHPGETPPPDASAKEPAAEARREEPPPEAIALTATDIERTGPVSLVVGGGQTVHAMDRAPDTPDRLGAVTIAIIVHAVLALLLVLAKVATPRPNPPLVTVSSVANTDNASLDSPTMTRKTRKSAAPVSSTQPVVSSLAFSSFAVPELDSANTDLSLASMSSSDAGFGISMSGFGDVSNMGVIPATMRSRCSMTERMRRLRESGGEDRAERAVRQGLDWLTTQQDRETGAIGKEFPCGMTGLALLAYLGHCETPESPKYGDAVVKATLYLINRAIKNDGLMTNGQKGHHEAYEHAIATYALAELYTLTKESGKEIPRLESVLRKAVDIIVAGQDPMGGWSYLHGGTEDMSVSGWNVQALKAAYNTGRNFSGVERALDRAVGDYLPAIQDNQGAFKYRPDDPEGKKTLTGAALLAMQIWGGSDTPMYRKAMTYLEKAYANPSPDPRGHGLYDEYYNTQAFFMHGGKEWEKYNEAFQPKLLDAQHADGSWRIGGGKGEDGTIMNSAWAILMLEVYYRYLPTTDKVRDLKVK